MRGTKAETRILPRALLAPPPEVETKKELKRDVHLGRHGRASASMKEVIRADKKVRAQLRRAHQVEYAARLAKVVQGAPTLGQGTLADASIQQETLIDYWRRMQDFLNFLEEREEKLEPDEETKTDEQLTAYGDHCYAMGELATEGGKMKAAF